MKESLDQTIIIKKLKEKEISLFTFSDFKKLFQIKKENIS